MSEFYDYLESAKNAEALPENFFEEVAGKYKAFEDAHNTFKAGAETTLSSKDEAIAAGAAEVQKLQALNFTLIQSQSVDPDAGNGDNGSTDDATGPGGIESLFQ